MKGGHTMGKARKPGKDGLNDQQRTFVYQYIINHGNAHEAGLAAGYAPSSVDSHVSRLLKAPAVKKKLAELREEQEDKYKVTVGRITRELAVMAFSRITDLVEITENEVRLKPVPDMGEAEAAIQTIKIEDGRMHDSDGNMLGGALKTELKMTSKLQALELLGKHKRMFINIVEHGGSLELKQAEAADQAYKKRFAKAS